VRLVLANNHLRDRGGSETYLLTVAHELERLGHDVVLFAGEPPGDGVPLARSEGLRFATHLDEVGPPPDRVLVQDGIVSGVLAAAYPNVPQLLVAHGVVHAFQLPPVLPGAVRAVVALNERVAARARATAGAAEVVRLRQPVDLTRFRPGPAPHEPPVRLLLFGNHQDAQRIEGLRRTCEARGIDVVAAGGSAGAVASPENVLAEADIVVGYGRCIVEAMATGRCAYVYDRFGSDGWLDAATYAALEATGFNGKAGLAPPGVDDFATALNSYDPRRGLEGRDLAYRHHDVRDHVAALLRLLLDMPGAGPAEPVVALEIARLWREQWRWERRVVGATNTIAQQQQALDQARREASERVTKAEAALLHAQASLDEARALTQRLADAQTVKVAEVETLRAELDARSAALAAREAELAACRTSRRYRVGDAIANAVGRSVSRSRRP
jgi:hypothetical protein